MKPKYTGIVSEYGDKGFNENSFVPGTTIHDLKPGDLVYLKPSDPCGHIYKCEFIKLEKTALYGKVVAVTQDYKRDKLGTILKVRYTSAMLWGPSDPTKPEVNDLNGNYAHCHWFVKGGVCV